MHTPTCTTPTPLPPAPSPPLPRKKALLAQRQTLPAWAARDKLVELVQAHNAVIIVGETGSGKTTQIPQFLAAAPFARGGCVACTQPRRVAAVTVARRVAEESGCRLGDRVGYSVRFDDTSSPATRIKYLTDGMLLREALADPTLKHYRVGDAHIYTYIYTGARG